VPREKAGQTLLVAALTESSKAGPQEQLQPQDQGLLLPLMSNQSIL